MKRSVSVLFMFLVSFMGMVHGMEGKDPEVAEVIVNALQSSADGWNAGDLDAFLAPYDATARYMTGSGPVEWDGMRARYREKYFEKGRPEQALEFDRIEVRELGGGIALVTGRFRLSGGGQPEGSGWFSLIWKRTPAGWRIIHDHSS